MECPFKLGGVALLAYFVCELLCGEADDQAAYAATSRGRALANAPAFRRLTPAVLCNGLALLAPPSTANYWA